MKHGFPSSHGRVLHCIYTPHPPYPLVLRHLGYFHIWAIVNWCCSEPEYRYLFEILILFPLNIHPEVRLLDDMVVLVLIFWGAALPFWIVAAPIYIPTNSIEASLSSTSLPTLAVSRLFDNSYSTKWEWHCTVALICISLMISDTAHLFRYPLYIFSWSRDTSGWVPTASSWRPWGCCWMLLVVFPRHTDFSRLSEHTHYPFAEACSPHR